MSEISTSDNIRRHDSPAGRFYEHNGIYKPSVTTVISNVITKGKNFERWIGDKGTAEADRIGKEAMERGTRVHLTAESLLNGLPYNITPELIKNHEDEIKMAMGFILWHTNANPEIIGTEKILYHSNHPAAGACDIYCKVGSEHWVVDIKTGNHYNTHQLQLTAYGWLVKDIYGLEELPKIATLRLYAWKGKPKYDWHEYKYADSEWTACNILYNWMGAQEPSRLPDYPDVLTLKTNVAEKLSVKDGAYAVELDSIFNNGDGEPTTADEHNEEYIEDLGNIFRKSGQILRKKKCTQTQHKELVENNKLPKNSIWVSDKKQIEEETENDKR
jgi:hypothetical protein|tara:strand:- start:5541 stop:6530 length:990 start_codon:yes stop_codon:yes gene_type:complete